MPPLSIIAAAEIKQSAVKPPQSKTQRIYGGSRCLFSDKLEVGRGLCLWAIYTAFRLDPPCSLGNGRLSRRAEDPHTADRLLALQGDVVYSPHIVKVEEPAAGYPVRIPVAPEVARRAMDFVRQFPGCFWFWKEEPSLCFRDDVEAVIRNLRNYGDKSAWAAAKELRRCL